MSDAQSAHKRIDHLELRMEAGFNQLNEKIDRILDNFDRRRPNTETKKNPNIALQITVFALCFSMLGSGVGAVWNTVNHHMNQDGHLTAMRLHSAFAKELEAIQRDLASRKGIRFNMPHYNLLVLPQIEDLKERTEYIEMHLTEKGAGNV